MKTLKYLLIAVIAISAFACTEDDEKFDNPSLSFKQGAGFVYQDTTLKIGESIKIGIEAATQSDVNLSSFKYDITADMSVSIDSGINTESFEWVRDITKGISDTETWEFTVSDKDGRSSSLSITLTKDDASSYGTITRTENIILGAQDNTNGSFFSFEDNLVYNLADAAANSEKIDMVYFFDEVGSDANAIASPGANFDEDVFAGQYSINDWTTKNTTRYEKLSIDAAEFLAAENDSLILANTFEYSSGKRKAKELSAGDIYSFVSETEMGMFMVSEVKEASAGTIKIDIIISE